MIANFHVAKPNFHVAKHCLLFLMALLFSFNLAVAAETISAPDALQKVQQGSMILIDIRRPSEWKQTGIASVAVPLSMHEEGFLEGLAKIREENPGKQIALICATGGRTTFIQAELKKRGLGDSVDVTEGMMGNGRLDGWIKRGLPIKAY